MDRAGAGGEREQALGTTQRAEVRLEDEGAAKGGVEVEAEGRGGEEEKMGSADVEKGR